MDEIMNKLLWFYLYFSLGSIPLWVILFIRKYKSDSDVDPLPSLCICIMLSPILLLLVLPIRFISHKFNRFLGVESKWKGDEVLLINYREETIYF